MKEFDLKFAHQMAKKYAEKFVAVVNEKVYFTFPPEKSYSLRYDV